LVPGGVVFDRLVAVWLFLIVCWLCDYLWVLFLIVCWLCGSLGMFFGS
jgi:hypothetical protein